MAGSTSEWTFSSTCDRQMSDGVGVGVGARLCERVHVVSGEAKYNLIQGIQQQQQG